MYATQNMEVSAFWRAVKYVLCTMQIQSGGYTIENVDCTY